MRKVGKVKWFGGYNTRTQQYVDYGFITPSDLGPDLYVHKRQLKWIDAAELDEGVIVSFDSISNPRDGKLEAQAVRLFDAFAEPSLVVECINSNDPAFWRPVFTDYVAKLSVPEATELATKKVARLGYEGEKTSLISSLPHTVLLYSKSLREMLPALERLQVWAQAYANLSGDAKDAATSEIKECLKKLRRDSLIWTDVPVAIQLAPDIWPMVPHDQRTIIVRNEIDANLLISDDFDARWKELSRPAKMMLIFRSIKRGEALPSPLDENDALVTAVLQLIGSVSSNYDKIKLFQTFHATLQDYVVHQAWFSSDPLNFFPLLPDCLSKKASKVQYCEARPWPTKEDVQTHTTRISRAFCPRLDRDCVLFEPGAVLRYGNQGARLYPEREQDWFDWSLLEVFEALQIVPALSELRNPNEYVQKLSGWINRLNEIRARLKCSACAQIMPPNYEYAKNLARYNMTVVSCEHGDGHDKNIYLNHCWGCEKVIDSRESTIRVEGYYICIHCGSGPQSSQTYEQGDICPRCGTPDMRMEKTQEEQVDYTAKRRKFGSSLDSNAYPNKTRVCSSRDCSHKIRLPAARNRTGQ